MMSFIVWRALSSAAYNIKMSHSAVIINEKINAARASDMNDRSKKETLGFLRAVMQRCGDNI